MVLLVTGAVFFVPIAAVWQLRSSGAVTSLWLAVLIAIAISMTLSWLLKAYWTRGPHQSELLFSELLIWGWFWHLRRERQLANAAGMLWRLQRDGPPGPSARLRGPQPTRAERLRMVTELADAVDAQDIYLHGHSRRVARHAEMIGRRMGLSSQELGRLRAGAIAHDVGKLTLPRTILDKPGALTEEEFALVKRHPEEGAKIVAALGDRDITAIVRHHHERFDGRGYPWGLAGPEIPLGARIVAVADTFDAITSARPYRAAELHREAIATIRECSGSQLDPEVVNAFLASYAGRRQALVLAGLLAAPQQALARLAGSSPGSARTTAANAAAIVAVTAAVAAAAGTAAPASSNQLSASVHRSSRSAVLAAHIHRSSHHAGKANGTRHTTGTPTSSAASKRTSSGKSRSRASSSSPGGTGRSPHNTNGGGSSTGASPVSGIGTPGHAPTTTGTVPGTTSPPGAGAPPGNGSPTRPPSTGAPSGQTGTTTQTASTTTSPPQTTSTTTTQTQAGPAYTPLAADTTTCNGVYGGSGQQVVVPSGATCTLVTGTQVSDLTVQDGGVLMARGITISHDLQADGGVTICGTTIEHDLHVEHASGGAVTIGDLGSCAGDTIGHDLQVENNAVPVTVAGDHVGHDLQVHNNSGGSTVSGNSVGHDARCDGNNPVATGQANSAGHEQDCPG